MEILRLHAAMIFDMDKIPKTGLPMLFAHVIGIENANIMSRSKWIFYDLMDLLLVNGYIEFLNYDPMIKTLLGGTPNPLCHLTELIQVVKKYMENIKQVLQGENKL